MLEQELRRRIFQKLESMDESLVYDIESLCECRSIIRTILMLYYYDHSEDLKDAK